MKNIAKIWSALMVFAFPILVSAQTPITNIDQAAVRATKLGQLFITLAISFAVIWIIGSVVWYLIKGASDEEARKKGGQSILYGVIGLFVILSIWGLVTILRKSVPVDETQPDFNNSPGLRLPTPPPATF